MRCSEELKAFISNRAAWNVVLQLSGKQWLQKMGVAPHVKEMIGRRRMESWNLDDGILEFPSGRRVRGRSWQVAAAEPAELSLVLTTVTGKEFAQSVRGIDLAKTITIDWPDERLPRRAAQAIAQLRDAWQQAATKRVEIACRTGLGRTGTALAVIATFEGMSVDKAISFVRENYHAAAISSPAQRGFLREYVSQNEWRKYEENATAVREKR